MIKQDAPVSYSLETVNDPMVSCPPPPERYGCYLFLGHLDCFCRQRQVQTDNAGTHLTGRGPPCGLYVLIFDVSQNSHASWGHSN